MVSLRIEITTKLYSIFTRGKEFSVQQRVVSGYGAHRDPFSKDTAGGFFGNITTWEVLYLTADCLLVFNVAK
jgi:hypothetical protein